MMLKLKGKESVHINLKRRRKCKKRQEATLKTEEDFEDGSTIGIEETLSSSSGWLSLGPGKRRRVLKRFNS